MCTGLYVKNPVIFSELLMKLEFSQQIFEKKIRQVTNFMKIRLLEAVIFHAEGHT